MVVINRQGEDMDEIPLRRQGDVRTPFHMDGDTKLRDFYDWLSTTHLAGTRLLELNSILRRETRVSHMLNKRANRANVLCI